MIDFDAMADRCYDRGRSDALENFMIEVWHDGRKVTVYANTVLRIWGTNIDTEMDSQPRDMTAVQAAFDWLYGVQPS